MNIDESPRRAIRRRDCRSGMLLLDLALQVIVVALVGASAVWAVQKMADSVDALEPQFEDHTINYASAGAQDEGDWPKLAISDRPIYKMSVSSPAGTAVVCGIEHHAEVRDLNTAAVVRVLEIPNGEITSVAQSADGRWMIAGCMDGTLGLWDARDRGASPKIWTGHQTEILCTVFSPDGRWAASGDESGAVSVWESATGQRIASLSPGVGSVSHLNVSPDGDYLAAARFSGNLQVWDTGSWRTAWTSRAGVAARCAAFSPDGRLLLTCGFDRKLRLWDMDSGEELWSAPTGFLVLSAAFSSDGRRIVTGSSVGFLQIWDAAQRRECDRWPGLHQGAINNLQFSEDGTRLFSAGYDGELKQWEWRS